MEDEVIEPTHEMIEFYLRRTGEHIERVRKCLAVLAETSEYRDELLERGKIHDASKFGAEEKVPYIWLTEFHRCRRENISFSYPPGMEEQVKKAIQHHLSVNRHHPEYHAAPDEMTQADLIEMVCDWTAMAQEFGEPNGSAKSWADKTIGQRVNFSSTQVDFIYEVIAEVDLCFSNTET